MPFILNGNTTGLLGYRLRKELLGEGLFYREAETYNLEIYARPSLNSATPYSEVEANIKSYFASASGDITVKVLGSPADYTFPNDHLRVGKFSVEVEIKKPIASLQNINTELSTNRYRGLDQTFFLDHGTWFEGFSEDFNFEIKEGGIDVYSHNISFSLLSGGKTKAVQIASGIFSQDKNTELGVNILGNHVAAVADSGTYANYFSETYDLASHRYSFSKRRESLPFSGTPYFYDLSHSITYKGDGFVDVTERGNIQGRMTFNQAKDGFGTLYPNAYSRCNTFYSDFKNLTAGITVSESLVNLPMDLSKTFNKLANSVEYTVTYTNDTNINTANMTTREKVTEIERVEEGFVNINQSFSYGTLRTPISGGSDTGYVTILEAADVESASEITSLYSTSSFYNPQRPNMRRVRITASTPNRKKQFGISMNYTNNPIYFVTLDSVTYAVLDYRVADTKPADMHTEYKVINRPTKTSVVNYAYQTAKGTKLVTLTVRLQRTNDNMFITPRPDISTNLLSLYKYAVGKALEDFRGTNFIALSYHLANVRYSLASDNEVTLEVAVDYAMKKYTE